MWCICSVFGACVYFKQSISFVFGNLLAWYDFVKVIFNQTLRKCFKMYVSFVSISFPYFAIDLSRLTSTRAYQLILLLTLFTTSAKMLVFVFSYTVFIPLEIEVRGTLQFFLSGFTGVLVFVCFCMCAYTHVHLHMHGGVKDGWVDREQ